MWFATRVRLRLSYPAGVQPPVNDSDAWTVKSFAVQLHGRLTQTVVGVYVGVLLCVCVYVLLCVCVCMYVCVCVCVYVRVCVYASGVCGVSAQCGWCLRTRYQVPFTVRHSKHIALRPGRMRLNDSGNTCSLLQAYVFSDVCVCL